jgi:hypothetical protein
VRETERFVNEGRGWECRRCRAEDSKEHEGEASGDEGRAHEAPPSSSEASPSSTEVSPSSRQASPSSSNTLARFFREGESEEREPRLSLSALARWKDSTRGALVCPRCGAEEDLSG